MLTDVAVRRAEVREKDYKLADSGGLYLFVTKSGTKSWRLKYRFGGKEQRLLFGKYPAVSLATARRLRDDAKRTIRDGSDPGYERKKARLVHRVAREHLFEKVARDWFELQADRWKPVHANDVITSLERNIFPDLGEIAVADITKQMVLTVLRRIEDRGAIETAHRIKQRLSAIFEFAEAAELVTSNPADVGKLLKRVPPSKRYPALDHLQDIRKLIGAADRAGAHPVTRLASRFMALTAQRPGMVRRAPWPEFENIDWTSDDDAPKAIWRIPADRMKLEIDLRSEETFEHVVPLGKESVDVLRTVYRLTGRGQLVFPSSQSSSRPLSENTIGALYKRLGYKNRHVPHGWRSSFSTIMNHHFASLHPMGTDARLIIERHFIDLMLAHVPTGMSASELRYNRAHYLNERRQIAELWANLIMSGLKSAHTLLDGPRRPLANAR